jgi:NADH-quinone oxidoreductase E subunit
MTLEFSTSSKQRLEETLKLYPDKRAALLPALWLAQREFGYVSQEAMEYVAGLLGLSPAYVYGVSTFYSMYRKQPKGRHLIQVCTNISCALMGAEHVVEYLAQKLGIKAGGTTPDGKFSLVCVECLGACGGAPMMQVNDTYYENLTREKIDKILAELK